MGAGAGNQPLGLMIRKADMSKENKDMGRG